MVTRKSCKVKEKSVVDIGPGVVQMPVDEEDMMDEVNEKSMVESARGPGVVQMPLIVEPLMDLVKEKSMVELFVGESACALGVVQMPAAFGLGALIIFVEKFGSGCTLPCCSGVLEEKLDDKFEDDDEDTFEEAVEGGVVLDEKAGEVVKEVVRQVLSALPGLVRDPLLQVLDQCLESRILCLVTKVIPGLVAKHIESSLYGGSTSGACTLEVRVACLEQQIVALLSLLEGLDEDECDESEGGEDGGGDGHGLLDDEYLELLKMKMKKMAMQESDEDSSLFASLLDGPQQKAMKRKKKQKQRAQSSSSTSRPAGADGVSSSSEARFRCQVSNK